MIKTPLLGFEKGYMIPFSYDGRQLHKIGISFSTKTRTIEEWVMV